MQQTLWDACFQGASQTGVTPQNNARLHRPVHQCKALLHFYRTLCPEGIDALSMEVLYLVLPLLQCCLQPCQLCFLQNDRDKIVFIIVGCDKHEVYSGSLGLLQLLTEAVLTYNVDVVDTICLHHSCSLMVHMAVA